MNQGMPFNAALGEAAHACKLVLFDLGGTDKLNCTYNSLLNWEEKMCISGRETSWLPRGIAQFLSRSAHCYLELHNFWADQPFWELRNLLSE